MATDTEDSRACVAQPHEASIHPGHFDCQTDRSKASGTQEAHKRGAQADSRQLEPATLPRVADRSESIGESEAAAMAKRSAKHHKKWNRRLKIFFCCLGYKKNKESITDVASIFAEFYSDLNAPSSDIAAGFVLLSKYQAAQRQWMLRHPSMGVDQYLSGIPINSSTKFLDISTAEDSHLINDLIYYMNYSLAIFGWPLQVVDDPCMLCCIYPYLRLSPCCTSSSGGKRKPEANARGEKKEKKDKKKTKTEKEKKKKSDLTRDEITTTRTTSDEQEKDNAGKQTESSRCANGQSETLTDIQAKSRASIPGYLNDDCDTPIILEDNCCSCNAASAERRLAQHNYEIIYISYKSNINVVPFLVAADHSKQTIVVAIRGSMNLADMVTDLNGTVDKVPIDNCPDDWLCHRGITSAAVYVKRTLLEEHILERAFNCRPDIGSQDYDLIMCGHSLGAGAAAILGVLMRDQYPNLKAYLYSPPGGILSLPVVEYTKKFATGIILGNDTVARLGIAQLERLRYHSLLSLKSAQKTPGKILARALCPSICCGTNEVEYDPEQSLDLLHGTSGRSFDYNNTKIPFQVQPQVLYVPGRLIHIVKDYAFRTKTQRFWSGPIFQAVWTDNTTYDRIMISEGMFLDHLPNKVMHAMKMLFSRTLPGRRESRLSSSSVVVESPLPPSETDAENDSGATSERRPSSDHRNVRFQDVKTIKSEDDIECQSSKAEEDREKDKENDKEDQLARAKNVIEDDDNNNNNSEDLNNNNDAKLCPNLNEHAITS